jgi:uncharacterized membrane protein
MTDLGNGLVADKQAAVPTPSCIRARRAPAEQAPVSAMAATAAAFALAAGPSGGSGPAGGSGGSGRMAARAAFEASLGGVELTDRDRQFISRLVHWDKRNASSVASLLHRARRAGRDEAAITPRQLETVLAALGDAARYRSSGVAAAGCWDCDNIPGGRCAEHARDDDRARAYAELAAALSGPDGLVEPRYISGYRRRRPVAS